MPPIHKKVNTMLAVQQLFYSTVKDGNLCDFIAELKLIGVDCRDYPDFKIMVLNYNMFSAIKNHPVVNECRGLILSYDGEVICKPFTRFYNLGENGVDTFDFENSIVFEKVDGSLIKIYFCPATDKWEIGTRGTAFAEGDCQWFETFRDGVLDSLGKTEQQFQDDCQMLDKNSTRLYEWISPNNRIVTPYKKSELVFLCLINNKTGEEIYDYDIDFEKQHKWNVRKLESYSFNTQDECLTALSKLSGLEEGFVCYNKKTGDRIKIKSPSYLIVHRLRGDGLTLNSVCELVIINEVSEYVSVFPEDAEKFDTAQEILNDLLYSLSIKYETVKDIENQKDFSLKIKDDDLSCVLFRARRNNTNIPEAFSTFPVEKRIEWLKERVIEHINIGV